MTSKCQKREAQPVSPDKKMTTPKKMRPKVTAKPFSPLFPTADPNDPFQDQEQRSPSPEPRETCPDELAPTDDQSATPSPVKLYRLSMVQSHDVPRGRAFVRMFRSQFLDEADRILDLGFREQVNAIIDHLPSERQTLLFSATQTKSVTDLARLSLNQPVYVSAHEHADSSTPDKLAQELIVCEEHDKMNFLWSFLWNHRRSKTLVFLTSCKQVRYMREVMRGLRMRVPVLALYGTMAQTKRVQVFKQFTQAEHCALLATDIAARGLDFPGVDWVLQVDCPSTVEDYIHRVGRTARHHQGGHALLLLTAHQITHMQGLLAQRKIQADLISVDEKRIIDMRTKITNLLVQEPELKTFAQKAIVAFICSVHKQRDRQLFDVNKIDMQKYAQSLGLAVTPRVRFLRKQEQNNSKQKQPSGQQSSEQLIGDFLMKKPDRKKATAGVEALQDSAFPSAKSTEGSHVQDGVVDDVTFAQHVARKQREKAVRKVMKKGVNTLATHTVWSDEEERDEHGEKVYTSQAKQLNISEEVQSMREENKRDRAAYKQLLREKQRARKRKREMEGESNSKKSKMETRAVLGNADSGSEQDYAPDLSWLPDPDKKSGGNNSESEKEGDSDNLEDTEMLAKQLIE